MNTYSAFSESVSTFHAVSWRQRALMAGRQPSRSGLTSLPDAEGATHGVLGAPAAQEARRELW